MLKRLLLVAAGLCCTILCVAQAETAVRESVWKPLFDGKSLDGWKAGERQGSFKVSDGSIAADGDRAHLFYMGKDGAADFRNFEFSADVMTHVGANSGIYFHTAFDNAGWPRAGFEVQINNTQPKQGNYYEFKKTGSLYGIRNTYKSIVRDEEWFNMNIKVTGHRVQIRLNDVLVVDYVEATDPTSPAKRLSHGTFALQCHDSNSKALFKNLRVRVLPDTAESGSDVTPVVDDYYKQVIQLSHDNFPLVNFHAHLKGGLTMEEALAQSHKSGIFYGVAMNCGVGFSITNDAGIDNFLEKMRGQPVYIGMQAEGREWVKMFSREAIAKFDYVFTDSMTFSNDKGRRMRLWIKDEVEVGDKQEFMEMLVKRAVGILSNEPIDIYVNPTFLPDEIAAEYDTLWTAGRMSKVIDAAVRHGVAIEINARYKLPSPTFIKMAKKAGAKFSFGTNNGDNDIGRLDYCFQMIRECGLTAEDMFMPKPNGSKPVQLR
jgi:histidinol phosphatase-like PHP family hydrolase